MQTIKEQFIHHAAKAFFASAWADACEEAEQESMLSGKEIFDIMPAEIDPSAIHAAETLYMDLERINQRSIEDMMLCIEESGNGDRENSIESFGHYAAMQAMGHGVGLHDAFGSGIYETIKVPYVEFGSHSLSKDYF